VTGNSCSSFPQSEMREICRDFMNGFLKSNTPFEGKIFGREIQRAEEVGYFLRQNYDPTIQKIKRKHTNLEWLIREIVAKIEEPRIHEKLRRIVLDFFETFQRFGIWDPVLLVHLVQFIETRNDRLISHPHIDLFIPHRAEEDSSLDSAPADLIIQKQSGGTIISFKKFSTNQKTQSILLGSGSGKVCYLGYHYQKEAFLALCELNQKNLEERDNDALILEEVSLQKKYLSLYRANHPEESLVSLTDPELVEYQEGTTKKKVLILPYFERSFRDAIKKLASPLASSGEYQQIKLAQKTLHSLVLLHDADITHRDIKPENIRIKIDAFGNYYPVLIDFGSAHSSNNTPLLRRPPSVRLTPRYVSPGTALDLFSVPSQRNTQCKYFQNDVWAMGLTLLQLFHKNCAIFKPEFMKTIEGCDFLYAIRSACVEDSLSNIYDFNLDESTDGFDTILHQMLPLNQFYTKNIDSITAQEAFDAFSALLSAFERTQDAAISQFNQDQYHSSSCTSDIPMPRYRSSPTPFPALPSSGQNHSLDSYHLSPPYAFSHSSGHTGKLSVSPAGIQIRTPSSTDISSILSCPVQCPVQHDDPCSALSAVR